MFTVVEPPKEFEPLNERCRFLVSEILSRLSIVPESFKLRAESPLYGEGQHKDYVYVLREGTLGYTFNNRTLFYFQEGDIIGFERELDIFTPNIVSDFATVLERYPAEQFLNAVHQSGEIVAIWQEFLGRYIAALYVVARSLFKDNEPVLPEVRSYPEGTLILAAGTTSDEIFTMADGVAIIEKNGETVGTITSDEVFGLYGALTNSPRIASVKAVSDCLVLAMNSKNYLDLILSRPHVVQTLLSDMAQTIVNEGKQLAGGMLKL